MIISPECIFSSTRYTPQKIDIDFKLHPFIPEYVPAVGDADAFLKVTTPASGLRGKALADNALDFIDNLGETKNSTFSTYTEHVQLISNRLLS